MSFANFGSFAKREDINKYITNLTTKRNTLNLSCKINVNKLYFAKNLIII